MTVGSTDAVTDWFARPKLGLFLHFGLYVIEAWHEQDQMRRRIPRSDYEKLIDRFNPVDFDPNAILDLAESVGMEYVCLTTKHHDGFCLWDTKRTDFNVMNSPYGKDIVGAFAEACHARNFPFGLYYSVVDWHQPNYPNEGRHHEIPAQADDSPDWEKYMEFLKAQVTELCSNYGDVRHWFWDMNVPEYEDPSVNQLLRSLQPDMVINNRGFDEGDFGTPEREYGHDLETGSAGFQRPTEACNSVGTQSWGYRKDEDYYTSQFLIKSIDEMMVNGANYLLNVGPDANGRIPDLAQEILADIGNWYGSVRESFSDTKLCPDVTSNKQVLITRRENVMYVHVHTPNCDAVKLPPLCELPSEATLLNTGDELQCSVDVLPVHWKTNTPILRIRSLPKKVLDRGETLVIKLVFDKDPAQKSSEAVEFEG